MGIMRKCIVCEHEFPAIAEYRYTARESMTIGVVGTIAAQEEPGLFDAYDCPFCGCQNLANYRFRTLEEDENDNDCKCGGDCCGK